MTLYYRHSLSLEALGNLPPQIVVLCHNGVLVSLICDLPRTHSLTLFTIDATVKAHGVLCAYVAVRAGMIVSIRGAVFILKMVQCFAIITI